MDLREQAEAPLESCVLRVLTMKFLTPADIAGNYPVSRSALYAACRDGLLPYYRVPSRKGARGKYLIKEEDLLAWLESLRIEGCGPEDDGPLEHIR
jgi:Helix-turn-helix domain